MNVVVVLTLIAAGTGALAMWIHVRFPGLAPESLRAVMLHMLGAMVGIRAASTIVGLSDPTTLERAAAVAGAAYPALVYAFLTGIWMMHLLQQVMGKTAR